MKNQSDEICLEQLRSIKSSDYSNYTCVKDPYQDFAMKFLPVVDFFTPIRTLRVKSCTKPWFDIGVLNAI